MIPSWMVLAPREVLRDGISVPSHEGVRVHGSSRGDTLYSRIEAETVTGPSAVVAEDVCRDPSWALGMPGLCAPRYTAENREMGVHNLKVRGLLDMTESRRNTDVGNKTSRDRTVYLLY
jgi:hypothetical protein